MVRCLALHTALDALFCVADGTVWTWGLNGSGELGDGTTINSPRPVPVTISGCSRVSDIAMGGQHSAALCSGMYVPCRAFLVQARVQSDVQLFGSCRRSRKPSHHAKRDVIDDLSPSAEARQARYHRIREHGPSHSTRMSASAPQEHRQALSGMPTPGLTFTVPPQAPPPQAMEVIPCGSSCRGHPSAWDSPAICFFPSLGAPPRIFWTSVMCHDSWTR